MKLSAPFLLLLALLGSALVHAADPDPERILNFHRISESLATGGQVYESQVPGLQEDGVELVINLAIADPERNGQESFHITATGMSYVQIPVIWDKPTVEDLELFFAVMDARGGRHTLVHCFANYRASAFTYLYRVLRLGVPEEEARQDLQVVWDQAAFEEYPWWRDFIDARLAAGS